MPNLNTQTGLRKEIDEFTKPPKLDQIKTEGIHQALTEIAVEETKTKRNNNE